MICLEKIDIFQAKLKIPKKFCFNRLIYYLGGKNYFEIQIIDFIMTPISKYQFILEHIFLLRFVSNQLCELFR